MGNTGIEWTDKTAAVGIYGCSRKSRACRDCWAAAMAMRLATMPHTAERYQGLAERVHGRAVYNGTVRVDAALLDASMAKLPKRLKRCETCTQPWGEERWRECSTCGGKGTRNWRVFPGSMIDIFHPLVPFEHIDRIFDHFERRPHIDFQVLTKRPDVALRWWRDHRLPQRTTLTHASVNADGQMGLGGWHKPWWHKPWPGNVLIGATVENQEEAERRLPDLVKLPARRFLSCEPLLGRVDLTPWIKDLHWVIIGGEAGKNAEPTDPTHARLLVQQCEDHGVPKLFKQWGEWAPLGVDETPKPRDQQVGGVWMRRVGKAAAGRRLRGWMYNEFPRST